MVNYKNYSYEENEHLFGPGKRLLLFTQGCSLHCKGCVNRHLWVFGTGKDITAKEVLNLCKDCEGITLHGGEPLDQSDGLLEIIKLLKDNGKTVILFTGYLKKELTKPSQIKSWDLSDLVVSGRYVESKRNINLQFRGSTNQKVYRHKGKYKHYQIQDGSTASIFRFDGNGTLTIRGFRNKELDILLEDIRNVKKQNNK